MTNIIAQKFQEANLLIKNNNFEHAIEILNQIIKIKIDFAEAYYLLGISFKKLKKLNEAEHSYKNALKYKSNYIEAFYNLANLYISQGRFEEAEYNLKKTIEIKNDFAFGHNNLANIQKKNKKYSKAEMHYKKAIEVKPFFFHPYANFASMLTKLGRLEESEIFYKKAIDLEPNNPEVIFGLSAVYDYLNKEDKMISLLKRILKLNIKNYSYKALINLSIYNFINNNLLEAKKNLDNATDIEIKNTSDLKSFESYLNYLKLILNLHHKKSISINKKNDRKKLFILGDSHSLVGHQLPIVLNNENFVGESKIIIGCKQWHLGSDKKNLHKIKFEKLFTSFPKFSKILICIGEIDCRSDEGILKFLSKNKEISLKESVKTTVSNYLNYIEKLNEKFLHKIIIQGVPSPSIDSTQFELEKKRINLIADFNLTLKLICKRKKFGFLDIYELTNGDNGISNNKWNLDKFHLIPAAISNAFEKHLYL